MKDWTDELRYAESEVNAARSGDLTSRQTYIRSAIRHLQAADEAITAELEPVKTEPIFDGNRVVGHRRIEPPLVRESVGQQEHSEVLRAAGVPSEGDGGEHGAVMDAIRGH